MTFKKTLAAALAATTMLTSAGAALAAPGVTLGGVNMRDAPGTHGDIIDTLSKGTLLEIESCGGGWCAVEYDDEDGFISASYLALIGDHSDDDDDDDDDHDDDDEDYDDDDDDYGDHDAVEVEFCFGGGGFGGGWGSVCVES